MAVDSDNESLHSVGSINNMDESRSCGSDLTVKIPTSVKADSRSSKPVKLKRKAYEVGPKKVDRDARNDDQVSVICMSKLVISHLCLYFLGDGVT